MRRLGRLYGLTVRARPLAKMLKASHSIWREYTTNSAGMSNMNDNQIELLKTTILQDGTSALDYVPSWPEEDQPWALAGVLSCIGKGHSLNRLTINWEARDLRYGNK